MKAWILAAAAALSLATAAQAQMPLPPAAIYTDPPADQGAPGPLRGAAHPLGRRGDQRPGLYPAGAGPHPTVVLLHGLPGNEKNLDLAQAMRRAGWTVVTFNYRGSWGSPGSFSLKGNLADAKAALAYVRRPDIAVGLQIDPARLVMMGHSMGGWVTAVTAAQDPGLKGAALISAADMAVLAFAPPDTRLRTATENMEALSGVTAQSLADQMATLEPAVGFLAAAPALAKKPLLVLTSDDGLADGADLLVANVRKAGGTRVTTAHVATDHSWNSARIRLETEVLTWLAGLPK